MKHLLYLLMVLCSFVALAQENDTLFFDDDPDFELRFVPDKWKEESAVILAQKSIIEITKPDKKHYEEVVTTRSRIFLKDKAAVSQFSEFYFNPAKKVVIKIVKPNGTEIEIDTEEAIDVENSLNIPNFYKNISLNLKQVDYRKLAIRELEVGDVIDYIFRSKSDQVHIKKELKKNSSTYKHYINFGQFTYELATNYPKVKQSVRFILDKSINFNFKPLQGAPDLQELASEDEANKSFLFEIEDIERVKDEYFTYPSRTYPSIKFQMVLNNKPKHKYPPYLLSVDNDVLNEVDEDKLLQYLHTQFYKTSDYKWSRYYYSSIIKAEGLPKSKTQVEKAKEFYKMFQTYAYLDGRGSKTFNSTSFCGVFKLLLDKIKADYEIVVGIPKEVGSLDNLIVHSQLEYGLRVYDASTGQYEYFFPFTRYSTYDDKFYRLMGEEVYLVRLDKKLQKSQLSREVIKEYQSADNQTVVNVTLTSGKDFKWLNVNSETSYRGEHKSLYASNLLTRNDFKHSSPKYKIVYNDKAKVERYLEHRQAIQERQRLEYKENEIENDFLVQKYLSFVVNNHGVDGPEQWLSYNEKYRVGDAVRTAGPEGYILEIGRFITSQIAIKKEDLDRLSDVYVNYPRIFDYTIEFIIPKGYKVLGINDLNKKIETEAGSFESTAVISKNKLIVKTTKVYKSTFLPKEKWNEMVRFLDEAFNFYYSKVLIVEGE